jgi:ankyrin repeat protein
MKMVQSFRSLAAICALMAAASSAMAQAGSPPPIASPTARVLVGHTRAVNVVAFLPDGKTLLSGSEDGTIREWDVQTGKPGRVFTRPNAVPFGVRALAVAPDGATFISGNAQGTLREWDADTGMITCEFEELQGTAIRFIVFAPGGRTVLTVSERANADGHDLASLRDARTLAVTTRFGDTGIFIRSAAISPDGTLAAFGSWAATGTYDIATLWDIASGNLLRTTARFRGVVQIAFVADGKTAVVSSGDSLIGFDLDPAMRRMIVLPGVSLEEFESRRRVDLPSEVTWVATDHRITTLVCSPDNRSLATVSGSRRGTNPGLIVRVWDGVAGTLKAEMKDGGEINGIAFSRDAKMLAGAGKDGNVRLWELSGQADPGPRLVADAEPALITALNRGSTGRALTLLEAGADFHARSKQGITVPFLAARCGALDILKWLAAKGEDLKLRDGNGATTLMSAASEGYTSVIDYLVTQNVDKNARSNGGETALMSTAARGHYRAVQLLVKQGAEMDARAGTGVTALGFSAAAGEYGIAKFLVESGASVDIAGNDGVTPLMAAIREAHGNIVKLLLEHHADVSLTAKDGTTALALAERAKARELVALIKSAASSKSGPRP